MSTMQTARTQNEGTGSWTTGLGYESLVITKGGSSGDNALVDEDEIENIKVPIIEVGYRRGFSANIDGGLKLTLPGTLTGDVKYSLSGEASPTATAVGLSLGYISFSAGDSKYTIIDVGLPFYISHDMSEVMSLYFVPRPQMRMVSGESGSASVVNIGATVGMAYYWFIAEASYFTPTQVAEFGGIMQVMVGYWGGWDDVKKPWSKEASLPDVEERPKKKKKKKQKAKDVETEL